MRRFALLVAWCALVVGTSLGTLSSPRASAQDAQAAESPAAEPTDPAEAPRETQAQPKSEAPTEEQLEERDRQWDLRTGTTSLGPAGGIYVLDAASGAAKSFRLQAFTDFFYLKDYLYNNDKARYTGSAFALSMTPVKYLEISAAFYNMNERNSRTTPKVLSSLGNLTFDVKAWGEPVRGLAIGGDLQLAFLSSPNKLSFEPAATSIGMRANVSLDFRKLVKREAPLILRGNFGYYFDNSAKLVRDTEAERFQNLKDQGVTTAADSSGEYRQLARRDERLAFGINRVDHVILALGLEVPIEATKNFAIHPIAEWQWNVPVNRQNFDCPYVVRSGGKKLGGTDSCLSDTGLDVFTQNITAGVRFYPALKGVNLLLAGQLGVGGSTNFVQELAPNAPYRVILAAGYTADLKEKKPEVVVQEVEKQVEVAPELGRVRGRIEEQGAEGVVVPNAKVSFPGREVSALLTGADGSFVSYAFPPSEVQMNVEAEGYEPGTCTAAIPQGGGDVSLVCMLTALPRVGSASLQVLGDSGAPIADVPVVVVGENESKNLPTNAEGRVTLNDLPPGEYRARIDREGFLPSVTTFVVKLREHTDVTIQLVPVPKRASVQVKGNQVQVRGTIFFAPNTADIEARSTPLLTEIASVLMAHPELLQVEVQGHTDDTGSSARNAQLSQERAEAVKNWLTKAGVAGDRLVAKGYGAEKPIAPNVNEQNRAKNRRVEFVILQRAGQ